VNFCSRGIVRDRAKIIYCTAQNENVWDLYATISIEDDMRDRRGKFVKLANQRVSKAIDQIRLIGNLSNRAAYEFTEDDARKIVKALQKAVDAAKARFSDTGAGADQGFTLE